MAGKFDVTAANEAALAGMARAYDAAPEEWKEEAHAVVERLATERAELTADDVWAVLWQPPEPRALGGVMRKAAGDGVIAGTGRVTKSARPVAHRAYITVWRSLIHKERNVIRFFLAHAKSDDEERIRDLTAIANAAVARAAQGKPFEIITGRDYFERRFKAAGSWEAWTAEVAAGMTYPAREPVFHGILVPSLRIGHGTSAVVTRALAAGKPCFYFTGDTRVARVQRVARLEMGDWREGWTLIVGDLK